MLALIFQICNILMYVRVCEGIQLPEAQSRHRAYLGVSEATFFETVFETQKNIYKKDQKGIICGLF